MQTHGTTTRLSRGRDQADAQGIFGLTNLTRCGRLSIAGKGDLSWIMRRLDERVEREREAFEATYDEDADLPAWMEARRRRTPTALRIAAT